MHIKHIQANIKHKALIIQWNWGNERASSAAETNQQINGIQQEIGFQFSEGLLCSPSA